MKKYKTYLNQYAAYLLVVFALLLLNALYLFNLGEFLSLDKIAAIQKKQFVIYGTALHDDFFSYKTALYEKFKPDIIAVGSSRVMQFREWSFSSKFTNMGGSGSLDNVSEMLHEVVGIHKPKAVLLGVDFWWFNGKAKSSIKKDNGKRFSLKKMTAPWRWIFERKITLFQYRVGLTTFKLFENTNKIGVAANTLGAGFASDGSHYSPHIVTGHAFSEDRKFSDSLSRISEYVGIFQREKEIDINSLVKLDLIVSFLEEQDIDYLVFMPPLAPTVLKEMEQHENSYKYITQLRKELSTRSINFFDFHDAHLLSTSDCEFIDGPHGGDLLYARMLYSMIKTNKGPLRKFVNMTYLDKLLKRYQGLAMIPDEKVTTDREVDFLDLGCDKIISKM